MISLHSQGQTRVGSANIKALCKYHSCKSANMIRPSTRTQASQRQNWFLPVKVKSKSSTPLFAKSKHIPDMMPENDANEMAKTSRVRLMERRVGFIDSDGRDLLPTLRSRRGVRSVANGSSMASEVTGIISEPCGGRWMFIDEGDKPAEDESDAHDLSTRREREISAICV